VIVLADIAANNCRQERRDPGGEHAALAAEAGRSLPDPQ